MADVIKFKPEACGEVGRLLSQLYDLPRPTDYQQLCCRIASTALDLPIPTWRRSDAAGLFLRQCDHLWEGGELDTWIIEAARIDEMASMVILDAVEFVSDWFKFLTGDQRHECFGSGFKRDYTDQIKGTLFVFQIPVGWELSLGERKYDEGNYGAGEVLRCHLSISSTHENWALGNLVGRRTPDFPASGYFGVPCRIVRHFKRTPVGIDDELWSMPAVTGTIPFQWITHAVRQGESRSADGLEAVSNESGILAVASRAIEAVKVLHEQIAERLREAQQPPN